MNWLKKLPGHRRAASGLEWQIWRRLPGLLLLGTVLPALWAGLMHVLAPEVPTPAEARELTRLVYITIGIVVFHWSVVLTAAIGCLIVMVMKGPAYVADAYAVDAETDPRVPGG